jgi:hypothetical protein
VCWISGEGLVAGREAIVLECDHPRTTEMAADRPDYHLQVAFDRVDGIVTRLVERIRGEITRHAEVVAYDIDVTLPQGTFELAVPEGAKILY